MHIAQHSAAAVVTIILAAMVLLSVVGGIQV